MTIRYYTRHRQLVPEYVCQREGIERGEPLCQRLVGADIDSAVGELLVESVTPLALEVALAVQEELQARADEADRLRRQQVERARYEAELAQRRYLRVDPDNRLVADSLEADWNQKLRACTEAQEDYERQRQADGQLLDGQQREQILALATDFPRLWRDPAVPQRERKRMIRLLLEDVTLLRMDEVVAHVRFRGGATHSLRLPLPLSAWQLRKTDPAVVAEIDRLLDHHTEAEIAEDRYTRLRRQGLLTLEEISELLGADSVTVKVWGRTGHIPSHVYNDKGSRLYERPASLQQPCRWCGEPIPAKPALRRGKK
jgi:hypothetical protein